ncbi:MAG: Uma2 family endonuclease [Halothece sp. Uz-M2-17]|nr:Uma2 family endonuclease [Halothece sp. Uz-M2-17]
MMRLEKRLFTVSEYQKMAEVGILTERDRVELMAGEIIPMSPIGYRHAATVKRLNDLFGQRLGNQAIRGIQDPIVLDNQSQPQPDVVLLRPRSDYYASGHPQPKDIYLLVEVADISIAYDREVKIPLYAQAGISEVWLIDLNENVLEVYRNPLRDRFSHIQILQPNLTISSLAFPEITFTVAELVGIE